MSAGHAVLEKAAWLLDKLQRWTLITRTCMEHLAATRWPADSLTKCGRPLSFPDHVDITWLCRRVQFWQLVAVEMKVTRIKEQLRVWASQRLRLTFRTRLSLPREYQILPKGFYWSWHSWLRRLCWWRRKARSRRMVRHYRRRSVSWWVSGVRRSCAPVAMIFIGISR